MKNQNIGDLKTKGPKKMIYDWTLGSWNRINWTFSLILLAGTLACGTLRAQQVDDEQRLEFFEKKIRPIFVEHCYNCHS